MRAMMMALMLAKAVRHVCSQWGAGRAGIKGVATGGLQPFDVWARRGATHLSTQDALLLADAQHVSMLPHFHPPYTIGRASNR